MLLSFIYIFLSLLLFNSFYQLIYKMMWYFIDLVKIINNTF